MVALIRARYPSYTPAQVVSRLVSTADDLGRPGYENRYGNGRVNAFRAVGGSVAAPAVSRGDALEPNHTLVSARAIPLGTTRPSLYPAGDVDVFTVQVPRAGRLDVRVTGLVDTRVYPWNGSGLPIDPIVELYSAAGVLLRRVDAQSESGTELVSAWVTAPATIYVRVLNYYANGNRSAYSVTPSFVDTVAPAVISRSPAPGAVRVRYDGAVIVAGFSEPVSGVGADSVLLKNSSGAVIPAAVSYASSSRRATLRPSAPLAAEATYQVQVTTAILDAGGNALAASAWSFTTGKSTPRIAGEDRFGTAAAVSRASFDTAVPVVYIADGTTFPDALAGGPAARVGGGPLLLTAPGSLPAATTTELARLTPGRIVVLGGTGAVSASVEGALDAYTTGTVTRVAGPDRYATAAAVSASAFPAGTSVAYVATGMTFPDALAAGAAAARAGAPILLVEPNALPGATAAELARLGPDQIVVMGGTGIVSDAVLNQLKAYAPTVRRVSGEDRYATAVSLSASNYAANSVGDVYLASGTAFPDGLSVGPLVGRRGLPLLLVPPDALPASVAAELLRLDPSRIIIIGGTSVVSEALRQQILALWP